MLHICFMEQVGTKLPRHSRVTVRDYLKSLAFSHKQFNVTAGYPHLTDYGGDKRMFLEMVPTYIHALPSLNFAKAGMLLSIGDLEPDLAKSAQAEAEATIAEAVQAMYVQGEGVWASVYPNGSRVAVRTCADFAYIGQAMGTLLAATKYGKGKRSGLIPPSVWKEMSQFAWSELWVPESHWVVALSPKDGTNSPSNLLIRRADWGTGGTSTKQ